MDHPIFRLSINLTPSFARIIEVPLLLHFRISCFTDHSAPFSLLRIKNCCIDVETTSWYATEVE
ncbi:hypothetical protein C0J52_02093 [Blattella germanica]|nr:hypothetical protein C0J52_02093 [Blattella germanica]